MPPTTVVIFGASGDLTQRKLVPALYNLCRDGLLTEGFALVGFARRPKSDEQFRDELSAGVASFSRAQPIDAADWGAFAANIRYHQSDFDDPQGYAGLKALLDHIDDERGAPSGGNRLFYLATPPDAYPRIVTQHRAGWAGVAGSVSRKALFIIQCSPAAGRGGRKGRMAGSTGQGSAVGSDVRARHGAVSILPPSRP
ncbi:MAG: hypothetical protein H7Z19_06500 [Chitinophagaceae bacterium]|nr:hypothetical protein [Rubrivivax sp.]